MHANAPSTAASGVFYKRYLKNLFWGCFGSANGQDAGRCNDRRRRRIAITCMAWVQPQEIALRYFSEDYYSTME